MLAITVPKLPAPTTPIGFSDELLKVITYQPVVIIVERVEVFGDDVSLFILQHGPFQVKYSAIIEAVTDNQVGLALEMCGVVNLTLILQVINFFSNPFKCFPKLFIRNFEFLLG
jgi:hypothetical protein